MGVILDSGGRGSPYETGGSVDRPGRTSLMPPSKDMIGRELSRGSATVDGAHVAAFAAALGDANRAYTGTNATAPLTYPIAFMTQAMAGGMNTFLELGLNFMTLV